MKPENKAIRDDEPKVSKYLQKLIDEHMENNVSSVYRRCELKQRKQVK